MNWNRLQRIRHTAAMYLIVSAQKRAKYLKVHDVFYHMGDRCMIMFRKIPLYPKLISIGNNVWIASDVLLIPHDTIHRMLNNAMEEENFQENLGCIDIRDNVFIGSGSKILPGVRIGSNTVIAAGSIVNKSLSGNGVYGGVPAKYIGSLEELISKRRDKPKLVIKKDRHGLSRETVEAAWDLFIESGGDE